MCVKEIVVETCDTCLRYTPPSAMTIFGLRISNFTRIRMWLHPPVYHCRFPVTVFSTPASSAALAYQYMCWCDHFKYVPEYRATLFLQGELGQLYLLRSCYVSWCLVYSSCCDYIRTSLLCCHCLLCSPATVTCPLIVQEASVLAQRVSAHEYK